VLLLRYRARLARFVFSRGAVFVLLTTAVICTFPAGPLRPLFDGLFVLIGAPALVLWGSNADGGRRVEQLSTFLGRISYPLYAIHYPLAVLANFLSTMFPERRMLIYVITLLSTIPLSYLLARAYDAPLRRLLSRWWHLDGRSSSGNERLQTD
jgi:peptidoglycan/LPS O-acetylase OafA/YrhL